MYYCDVGDVSTMFEGNVLLFLSDGYSDQEAACLQRFCR
jgi:hypothetical protein